jgi:hypothetical protein
MRPSDTSPEAWKVYIDLYGHVSPGEKIRRAMSMTKTINLLAEAGLRRRFPEAGDREIFLRRAQLVLGQNLFRKAYGAEFK